ncbi:MAG: DUF1287 domain-containing protein [Cytobacillus gottheilii]|uniref:DUF1287 domain-containing protein n=1 Tax=Cytobacillus gottheilii TaxID=859144 RepID=UPI000AF26A1E|nr:DUF1287 domain-containing protein [Cytobacillus gottheilii]
MHKKKLLATFKIFVISFAAATLFAYFFRGGLLLDHIGIYIERPFTKEFEVPLLYDEKDHNDNGIPDPLDFVYAARQEVQQRTFYRSRYYEGGYPPDDEGVCTDVIWRAMLRADIHLKDLLDEDVALHTKLYPRVEGNPDPNIDFRRVPNQDVFFKRFAENLTTDLIPGEIENLKQWQPGDIVVFLTDQFQHVGIISDKRAKDGTPYLIHNIRPFAAEIKLSSFKTPITGHYRWKYGKKGGNE